MGSADGNWMVAIVRTEELEKSYGLRTIFDRVTLAVSGDPTRLQVDVSTNRFSELSLSTGSQVSIALPPERILVYSRAD